MLDDVRVEVLELQPILKEHAADELPGWDGEAALMERHERNDVALWRAQHGLILGHPPLLSVDERGQATRL
jgi:hypothetical protein